MAETSGIPDIIKAAAEGVEKLRFHQLPASDDAANTQIKTLAAQFDASEESWRPKGLLKRLRQSIFGGDAHAESVMDTYAHLIPAASMNLRSDGVTNLVPDGLVRAVMRVENQYNAGKFPGSRTALPMNVNFDLWQDAFAVYNAKHPEAPLTRQSIQDKPFHNVIAAELVLSTINAAIDPAIQGDQRWALVASMYGNSEVTLAAQRPIMYGAKVMQVMQEKYPLPAATQQQQQMEEPEVVPPMVPIRNMPARAHGRVSC